jgi:hypothetical protein
VQHSLSPVFIVRPGGYLLSSTCFFIVWPGGYLLSSTGFLSASFAVPRSHEAGAFENKSMIAARRLPPRRCLPASGGVDHGRMARLDTLFISPRIFNPRAPNSGPTVVDGRKADCPEDRIVHRAWSRNLQKMAARRMKIQLCMHLSNGQKFSIQNSITQESLGGCSIAIDFF